MKTLRLTVGQALIRYLDNQYVEFDGRESRFVDGIFAIYGHGIVLGLGEAMQSYDGEMRFYMGRNEQGMAHAAVGYAKQKNRRALIACAASIGPGTTNFVTAAALATVNRLPLLLLCGDTYACRQPDPVLQQLEQPYDYGVTAADSLKPVCKYWDRVTRPEQLMSALQNAMRVLTDPAETGAVALCLPQDAEGEAYSYPESFFERRVHHIRRRIPTEAELTRGIAKIRSKKRPLIICGGGVLYSEAAQSLAALAEECRIPFVETQAGKGALPWDHPLNLAAVGVSGSTCGNIAARHADLIIAVGTRLGDFTTSSRRAFEDEDAEVLSINVNSLDAYKMNASQIIADADLTLKELKARLLGYVAEWGGRIKDWRDDWFREVDRVLSLHSEAGMAQTRALGEMMRSMGEDAVIVSAAGSLPDDVRKFWKTRSYKGYHVEYGYSCMGYEVNAALGVKLAEPQRDVYAVVGDGTWQMLHSELITAIQEQAKITVVVFDNQGFGCIENLQNSQGIDTFLTKGNYRNKSTGELNGPTIVIDYAMVAEGYGARGFSAGTPQELAESLKAAAMEPGVCVIDAKVLPKSMGGRYESWWRVGTPQVSANAKVMESRREQDEAIMAAWKY